jgi:hypothetical protein
VLATNAIAIVGSLFLDFSLDRNHHAAMKTLLKQVRSLFQSPPPPPQLPRDMTEDEKVIYAKVRDYTMTAPESVASLLRAVDHVVGRNIPGDIVECGVWRVDVGCRLAAQATERDSTHSYVRHLRGDVRPDERRLRP